MNLAVIGSGGREHAICYKLKQSPKVKKIICLPGNAGTQKIAENIDVYKDTTHQHPTTPRPDIITEGQHPKSRGVYGENGTKQRAHTLTLFNERFTTVSAAIRSLEYRFFKQTSCTTGAKWLELKEGVTPLIYLNINNPDDLAKEVLKEEERSTFCEQFFFFRSSLFSSTSFFFQRQDESIAVLAGRDRIVDHWIGF